MPWKMGNRGLLDIRIENIVLLVHHPIPQGICTQVDGRMFRRLHLDHKDLLICKGLYNYAQCTPYHQNSPYHDHILLFLLEYIVHMHSLHILEGKYK